MEDLGDRADLWGLDGRIVVVEKARKQGKVAKEE